MLSAALKKTPFLLQEGRLLEARRACSCMKKGLFLHRVKPFLQIKKGLLMK